MSTDLTPREVEVMLLLAKGCKLSEVARLLDVAPHTANGHRSGIYRKLGVTNRAELAVEAYRRGMVDRALAPLTEGQMADLFAKARGQTQVTQDQWGEFTAFKAVVRDVERAHNIFGAAA